MYQTQQNMLTQPDSLERATRNSWFGRAPRVSGVNLRNMHVCNRQPIWVEQELKNATSCADPLPLHACASRLAFLPRLAETRLHGESTCTVTHTSRLHTSHLQTRIQRQTDRHTHTQAHLRAHTDMHLQLPSMVATCCDKQGPVQTDVIKVYRQLAWVLQKVSWLLLPD